MKQKNNVSIIIPSLNPDEKLMNVVKGLEAVGFDDIIIVDDGSSPEFKSNFPACAEHSSCTVLVHDVNKGKGAALKTAFKYFLTNRTDCNGVVTVDSDDQHRAADVLACAQAMCTSSPKVVLGARDFSLPEVPKKSRIGNKITSSVFKLFCGMKISDTQTGLRAIPAIFLESFINTDGDRYEYETNMLLRIKELHIPFTEVKIATVYIDENQSSHFRVVRDSARIYALILKFMLSSSISAIIDNLIFFVAIFLLEPKMGNSSVIASYIISRGISSSINFSINKKSVFKSKENTGKAILKYYILVAIILGISSLTVYLIKSTISDSAPIMTTLIKIAVDTVLFMLSFRIQRKWVFGSKIKEGQLI